MLATCAITSDPWRSTGGANGAAPSKPSPRSTRAIARAPSGPRATSTYGAPASSSASRMNSPRP